MDDSVISTEDETLYLGAGVTGGGTWDLLVQNGDEVIHYQTEMNYSMNFTAPEGSTVTMTAHSDELYQFMGWYEGVQGSSGFVEGNTGTLLSSEEVYTFSAENYKLVQGVFKYTKAYAVLLTAVSVTLGLCVCY